MQTVTVNKEALLEELKANRFMHKHDYDEILQKYMIETLSTLKKAVVEFENDKAVAIDIKIIPRNNINDYDVAIRMVEMSVDTNIEVSNHEFRQYIMDEWDWKHGFDLTKTMYGV